MRHCLRSLKRDLHCCLPSCPLLMPTWMKPLRAASHYTAMGAIRRGSADSPGKGQRSETTNSKPSQCQDKATFTAACKEMLRSGESLPAPCMDHLAFVPGSTKHPTKTPWLPAPLSPQRSRRNPHGGSQAKDWHVYFPGLTSANRNLWMTLILTRLLMPKIKN